jgi:hypothetical protein
VKFWHMHGKCAIWTPENGPQRPNSAGKHGFIPPPQGIGPLFPKCILVGCGGILFGVKAVSLV